MTAEEHDRIIASTSHLPFLISSALAHSTPMEFASLVGSGYRSTTRLAGTPSQMMMGILKSNRDNILKTIRTFRNSLDEVESALQDEDYSQLELFLNRSRTSYHSIIEN
jgi:prephenate dehydrogenase